MEAVASNLRALTGKPEQFFQPRIHKCSGACSKCEILSRHQFHGARGNSGKGSFSEAIQRYNLQAPKRHTKDSRQKEINLEQHKTHAIKDSYQRLGIEM